MPKDYDNTIRENRDYWTAQKQYQLLSFNQFTDFLKWVTYEFDWDNEDVYQAQKDYYPILNKFIEWKETCNA